VRLLRRRECKSAIQHGWQDPKGHEMYLAGTIRGEIEPSRTLPQAATSGDERLSAARTEPVSSPASPAAGLPPL